MIVKGYNNLDEIKDYMEKYKDNCEKNNIFIGTYIEKPTYEETTQFINEVQSTYSLDSNNIQIDLNKWNSGLDSEKISKIISKILWEYNEIEKNKSKIKNIYIRLMIDLKYKFKELMNTRGKMLYYSKIETYETILITILKEMGVEIVIVDLEDEWGELFKDRFQQVVGMHRNHFELGDEKIKGNIVEVNKILTQETTELEYYTKHILQGNRYKDEKFHKLNLEIIGVCNLDKYVEEVNNLKTKLEVVKRNVIIIENGIENPTYDESISFDRDYGRYTNKVEKIIEYCEEINKHGIDKLIEENLKRITSNKNFNTESAEENYNRVILIWLKRFVEKLFTENIKEKLPVVIVWGETKEREEEFIEILNLLPLDIIHLTPTEKHVYTKEINGLKKVRIGKDDTTLKEFPERNINRKKSTVAYEAEKDLDEILYTGNNGLYRSKQFKDINPIVLKTTYDEIGILWGQQTKFRPAFETVGNIVNVGTIFSKVNGIYRNDSAGYMEEINKLNNAETTLYDKLPFTPEVKNENLKEFVKRVVFRNTLDIEQIKRSKEYRYGIYSEETQELIFRKLKQLIELNWCIVEEKNLTYTIIEVVLSLSQEIMQKIHGYDFTGVPPKIIVYSGDTQTCSLEDSIVIMFLKLVGFDIVIYAPTGYRIIEQYIDPSIYNRIELGEYNYELVKLEKDFNNQNKRGIISRIFGK